MLKYECYYSINGLQGPTICWQVSQDRCPFPPLNLLSNNPGGRVGMGWEQVTKSEKEIH